MEKTGTAKIETAKSEGAACGGAPAKRRPRHFKAGVNFWVDVLAFLTFVICAVSGWALMAIHPIDYTDEMELLNSDMLWGVSRFEWLHLHNIIGWIFVALVAVHLVLHWRWVVRACSSTSSTGRACASKRKMQTEI